MADAADIRSTSPSAADCSTTGYGSGSAAATGAEQAIGEIRQRIGDNPRKLILLLGTGVSSGMTKIGSGGQALCAWIPFLRRLATHLPLPPPDSGRGKHDEEGNGHGNAGGLVTEREAVERVLGSLDPNSPAPSPAERYASPVVLGLGHMIRGKLFGSGKEWDPIIRGIDREIERDYDPERPWSRWFESIGERLARDPDAPLEIPLILTTNYDLLVARRLQARVLINPDPGSDDSGAGCRDPATTPLFRFAGHVGQGPSAAGGAADVVPDYLQSLIEIPLLWDLHQTGLLANRDMFVHHVHGAAHDPASVVFDAADYERVIWTFLWKPLAALLAGSGSVAVFAGVGEGMFDRHLLMMWRELRTLLLGRGGALAANPADTRVYWLRAEEEREAGETLLRAHSKDFPAGTIKMVTDPGWDWMPDWIDKVLGKAAVADC